MKRHTKYIFRILRTKIFFLYYENNIIPIKHNELLCRARVINDELSSMWLYRLLNFPTIDRIKLWTADYFTNTSVIKQWIFATNCTWEYKHSNVIRQGRRGRAGARETGWGLGCCKGSEAYLGGPLGHGPPLDKKFSFYIEKKLENLVGPLLCMSTSGQRKFPPFEILNTPL